MQYNIDYRHSDAYLFLRMHDKVMQSDTRFENLATVTLNISLFWVMMPCNLVEIPAPFVGLSSSLECPTARRHMLEKTAIINVKFFKKFRRRHFKVQALLKFTDK